MLIGLIEKFFTQKSEGAVKDDEIFAVKE